MANWEIKKEMQSILEVHSRKSRKERNYHQGCVPSGNWARIHSLALSVALGMHCGCLAYVNITLISVFTSKLLPFVFLCLCSVCLSLGYLYGLYGFLYRNRSPSNLYLIFNQNACIFSIFFQIIGLVKLFLGGSFRNSVWFWVILHVSMASPTIINI